MSLKAELHKTVMENNVMKMVKVDKVCVNPFSTVRMRGAEGEGYHIMVFGDVEHIKVFHIYLKFESGKVLHFHAETTGAEQGEHKH
jgi:copper(I)-binding protein